MNGRIYDPSLGRMLSPDPVTQAPGDGQNYNRYAYANNNPLKYSDLSGYCYATGEVASTAASCVVTAIFTFGDLFGGNKCDADCRWYREARMWCAETNCLASNKPWIDGEDFAHVPTNNRMTVFQAYSIQLSQVEGDHVAENGETSSLNGMIGTARSSLDGFRRNEDGTSFENRNIGYYVVRNNDGSHQLVGPVIFTPGRILNPSESIWAGEPYADASGLDVQAIVINSSRRFPRGVVADGEFYADIARAWDVQVHVNITASYQLDKYTWTFSGDGSCEESVKGKDEAEEC